MPAFIAPLLGFIFGVGFAWAAKADLARHQGSPATSRALLIAALFGLLVHAPLSAYFLASAPDWSMAYLLDNGQRSGLLDLALVLLDVASVPLGFVVAARSVATGVPGAALKIAAVPGVLIGAELAATLRRLSVNATFAQYHGNFGTHSVAGSTLGYAVLWMLAVLVCSFAWTAHCLRRLRENE